MNIAAKNKMQMVLS